MNFTSLIGFAIALFVIYGGVIRHSPKPELFLDTHAMILVLGGTCAAALIAFPIDRIINLVRVLIYGIILKNHVARRELVIELVGASITAVLQPTELAKRPVTHPFLREGYQLIVENLLTESELREVLQRRSKFFKKMYLDDAKLLTALAKFPPAFGLLGATSGMIAMMTNLGQGGQETIGPAMAIALVATFWGIAIANLILLPLADHAVKAAEEDYFTRQLIIEGLLLVYLKQADVVIMEKLNGFLPLDERIRYRVGVKSKNSLDITTIKSRDAM